MQIEWVMAQLKVVMVHYRGYGVNWKDKRKFAEYVKDPNIIKYPILIASKYALESALFF
jgi:hypothetical protein